MIMIFMRLWDEDDVYDDVVFLWVSEKEGWHITRQAGTDLDSGPGDWGLLTREESSYLSKYIKSVTPGWFLLS